MTARLNLAPEVYQNSQRNKRRRKLATTIAVGVTTVSVGLIILGLVILGGQKIYIATLQNSINDKQKEIETFSDLQAATTLAQHLDSLNTLSEQKVYMSRFFSVLQEFAPQGISGSNLSLNESNTLEFTGTAKTYNLANKFAKSLEFSNVQNGANSAASQNPYFDEVNITSISETGSGDIDFKLTANVSSEVTSSGN